MKSKNLKIYYGEFFGTFVLLFTIVGSGIMGQKLSDNEAITLLANAISIGLILFVLISSLRNISGAHFNPSVTLTLILLKKIKPNTGITFIILQIIGACCGVIFANIIFDLEPIQMANKIRSGTNIFLSEIFATFGLLLIILINSKKNDMAMGSIVGAYITSAIWFTSSTSFANPSVSIARVLSDTFTGINIINVPMFVFAQLIAVGIAIVVFNKFFR